MDGQMDQDLFEARRVIRTREGKSSGSSKTGTKVKRESPLKMRQLPSTRSDPIQHGDGFMRFIKPHYLTSRNTKEYAGHILGNKNAQSCLYIFLIAK